jgi:hypothetical protein
MKSIKIINIENTPTGEIMFQFDDETGLVFVDQVDMEKDTEKMMTAFSEQLKWFAVKEFLKSGDIQFEIKIDPENITGVYIERVEI